MPLILHLSDLHLSATVDEQITGDDKMPGLVPLAEQQNRLQLLRSSLAALATWLTREDRTLDAVVVTGDVSLKYDGGGFAALPETLAALGDHQLPAERVVVVPGNHDVKRGTPPSSASRYELFLRHVRGSGYVTPFLEGVDIDPANGTAFGSHSPLLMGTGGSYLIAATNSSNYSGSVRELSAQGQSAFEEAIKAASTHNATLKEIKDLLAHDIARVSPAQMTALRTALSTTMSPAEGGPIRIAAMHHQLLPVSADEEFKSFENLTDLGHVRQFLVAQEISAVAHGHKHQGLCYTDRVTFSGEEEPRPNEYLVSSAATVWRQQASGHEFARLIQVDTTYPSARSLAVSSLPSTPAGGEMQKPTAVRSWTVSLRTDQPEHRPFRARTANEAYERMMAFFERQPDDAEIRSLACVVQEGPSAGKVPDNYPRLDGVDDQQAWMDDIVAWWQRGNPDLQGRGRRFNHGERIRNLNRREQINDVVAALKDSPGTTRGLVQIVDLGRDQIANVNQRIPSFFACHFYLTARDRELHVTGYFRKQQIRMWWAVNVAELARLQAEVVEKLTAAGEEAHPGSITTFASVAVKGTDRPRVVVPRVDRLAQDAPQDLWRVAFDLFIGDFDAGSSALRSFFDDWRPTGKVERDGSAVSIGGLHTLQAAITLFADTSDSGPGRKLARTLENLHAANVEYAATEEQTVEASTRAVRYNGWSGMVERQTAEVIELLDELSRGRAM